jgi:hypothetical protein
MSRSVSVSGRRLLPTLNVSAMHKCHPEGGVLEQLSPQLSRVLSA